MQLLKLHSVGGGSFVSNFPAFPPAGTPTATAATAAAARRITLQLDAIVKPNNSIGRYIGFTLENHSVAGRGHNRLR